MQKVKSEKWLKVSNFTANEQLMSFASNRCGEDKHIATVFQFQFFAKFCNSHREIADGDISPVDTGKSRLQFVFVHRGRLFDDETAPREVRNILIGNKQMTVLINLPYPKPLLQQFKASGIQNGGIRLEQILLLEGICNPRLLRRGFVIPIK